MLLDWIGDTNLQCAVYGTKNDYTIFAASSDGTLRVAGPGWKKCPGMLKCKRPQRREGLKCKCSRKLEFQFEKQEQAMRMAAKIVEHVYNRTDTPAYTNRSGAVVQPERSLT